MIVYFICRMNSNNANADLLGLSTPPANHSINNGPQSGNGALIDVLGDIYSTNNSITTNNNNTTNTTNTNNNASSLAVYNTKKFLFKNNGVLFENEMLQIGVKSEFRLNLGRLGLFYGNKTQVPLTVSKFQYIDHCFYLKFEFIINIFIYSFLL